MNDLLAPIFVTFLCDKLETEFFNLENNLRDFEGQLQEVFLRSV